MSPGLSRRRVCGTRALAVSPVHEAVRQQDLSSLLAVATALRAHCSPTAPGPLQLCLEPHACPQLPPSRPRGLTPAVPAGRRAPLQRRFAAIRHTVRTTARGLELGGRSRHLLRLRANGELGGGDKGGATPKGGASFRLGRGLGRGRGWPPSGPLTPSGGRAVSTKCQLSTCVLRVSPQAAERLKSKPPF